MTTTITTPLEGFTGRTNVGAVQLDFEDGTATYDAELPPGARNYLLASGYGVDGEQHTPDADESPVVDSRDVADVQQVGSTLRDAAVDPDPGDFLAPVGAGTADPHGPDVVSPGLHAVQDQRPVKAGKVTAAATQDTAETAHTRRQPRS